MLGGSKHFDFKQFFLKIFLGLINFHLMHHLLLTLQTIDNMTFTIFIILGTQFSDIKYFCTTIHLQNILIFLK